MTHAEHAAERGSAREPGSVIAPTIRISEVESSRPRKQPCGSPSARLQSPRALGACGDFRYYVDSRGCQHFNFEQRIWRNPSVQMAVTPVMTIALETLALNLLAHIRGEPDDRARVGVTSKGLVRLARRFCAQCLLTASPAGWEIPRCTIEAWLVSQRRLQSSAPNGIRALRRGQGVVARKKKPPVSHAKESNTARRRKAAPHGVPGLK
jgi:hypothetical protein